MAPTFPDLNPLDYHVSAPCRKSKLQTNTDELKVALQTIWKELPQKHINKAVVNFTKCLTVYMAVAANDGHFEHMQ